MTTQQHISDREVGKSVKKAINEIHSEPLFGVVEATINAFSAMRYLQPKERIVYITLKAGINGRDTYISAPGTGIINYDFLEWHEGYDTDSEEYIESQKDPDYLNKMGIGIPTIASLSKDGIAEFRSVSLNTKGQEEGLVATYTLEGHGGWILPAEHPDSRYVFNVDDATPEITDMKTGVWAIVKNAKQYTKEKVDKKLSKIFARKLSAGYHIQLRETVSDTFEGVRQPDDFCNKHEIVVGMIHDNRLGDFPVYADIHPAEKPEDAMLELLTKKMTMDRYLSDYMAKGYFGCDVLDFKPDREGMAIDQYNPRFAQLEEIILREFRRQGIDKKPTEHMENQKRSKKWKEKATEIFLRYYAMHPLDSLLREDAMLTQKDAITGEPIGKRKKSH